MRLPDTPVFYEDLSLGEHLAYVAALHGVADEGGVAVDVGQVGLGERERGCRPRRRRRARPDVRR